MSFGVAGDSAQADSAEPNSSHSRAGSAIKVWSPSAIHERLPAWEAWYASQGFESPSQHPRWMRVFSDALGHSPYCIEQIEAGQTTAIVPLALMKSWLFGRFLVSLPYLNLGGVIGKTLSGTDLVTAAVDLADELNVRHLELRHETEHPNERINHRFEQKVHMRLTLPEKLSELWDGFHPKVRNQIRKGTKSGVTIYWGSHDLLDEFYSVFSQNMRDLGTPVFSKKLFATILREFDNGGSELCVARIGNTPVAAALLLHGNGTTEVPSASSLRKYNSTSANMTMYWHLVSRAVEKKQRQFDFGRSTIDSSTFAFKKQWGAVPYPALWQFYVRKGSVHSMRPECGRYSAAIRVWRKLPVVLTNAIGPSIIRGVP